MNDSTQTKQDLKDLTQKELISFVKELGLSGFRGKQIFSWLFRPSLDSFDQMTDLSLKLRAQLNEIATISTLETISREESEDGTIKYGFKLKDGHIIESVLIPEGDRNTLCVSSQVGCAMGCKFCLTGTMGFKRNLHASEIVNQVKQIQDELLGKGSKVNNIVFMGMGEPLANFNNLIKALDILLDQLGLNFSDRKITVSTCGLVPQILELGEQSKVNLAISLHGATDQVRDELMPINKKYPLAQLLEACKAFPLPKRRRIMIEYVMLAGINDSEKDAKALTKILHGIPCKINLLPFNECPELPFKKPAADKIDAFQEIVQKSGYTVIVRSSRGADISAACGQLAKSQQSQIN